MKLPSYFRMAKKAMLLSDSRFRLGACILSKRKVISIGFNQMLRHHPLVRKYDNFDAIHAEVSAILRIKNKSLLIDATIVIYRETKQGKQSLAKPCKVCQKILKDFGISKAIYCVELVKTTGEKILLSSTSQKSIDGIRNMLTKNLKAQARLTQAGVSLEQNYKSKKGTMILDDGNVIRFGETLRSQFHGQ